MTVRKILTIDKHDKLLHTPSEPVKKINREVKQLMQDIRDTIDDNPAVGLAAPQIGVLKRVLGVRLGYEGAEEETKPPTMIMVNPEIVTLSDDMENAGEACLSIPGMMGYTDRSLKIKVRYLDEKGEKAEREFEGWDARVVQHEIDHLDGILFIERLHGLEDLYVLVPDEDGKVHPVPYQDVIKKAAAPGKQNQAVTKPTAVERTGKPRTSQA